MRRTRLALLLPLLVAFAQQGALLHELTHLYYSGQALGSQLTQSDPLPDTAVCPTCQAFAQVTHPANGSTPGVAPLPASYICSPAPAFRIADAAAPTPRSRGPPQVLA